MKRWVAKDFVDPMGIIGSKEEADHLCLWVSELGFNLYLTLRQKDEKAPTYRKVFAFRREHRLCMVWEPKPTILALEKEYLSGSGEFETEVRKFAHYFKEFQMSVDEFMRLVDVTIQLCDEKREVA